MTRLTTLVTAALCAAALTPVAAHADDAMCRPGDRVFSVGIHATMLGLNVVCEAGDLLCSLVTGQPGAAGTALTQPPAQGGSSVELDDLLWCTSPDDPRCAPSTPSQDAPLPSRITSPSFHLVDVSTIPAAPMTRVAFPDHVGHPASGTRTRLDRPPRV